MTDGLLKTIGKVFGVGAVAGLILGCVSQREFRDYSARFHHLEQMNEDMYRESFVRSQGINVDEGLDTKDAYNLALAIALTRKEKEKVTSYFIAQTLKEIAGGDNSISTADLYRFKQWVSNRQLIDARAIKASEMY